MTVIEFNKQLDNFYGLFFGNAMRLTSNHTNAKDLMQETIMRAFASSHKFTEGTNFKAWVYTIMQHCFINDYRKRLTQRRIVHLEDNRQVVMMHPTKNAGPSIVMMKELHSMVENVCDTNRIPFQMHVDGFGYLEIAEQLNIPVGTVKSRIFMARKKLKHVVIEHYGAQVAYA